MFRISPLSLYIINQVRFRRLVLGLSSKALSRTLEHSPNYVATIESLIRDATYPPHELPKLAAALSCHIHDLLPPDEMNQHSDGSTVEKKVLSLSNDDDAHLVLEGLIKFGFFDSYKSEADVANHLFIEGKEESKVITAKLEQFANEGILLKNNDLFITS